METKVLAKLCMSTFVTCNGMCTGISFWMLLVSDLNQDCGSVVLHASFDANPFPPPPSCSVNILYV